MPLFSHDFAGELSTATAFTALSLFTMLRGPLSLIPVSRPSPPSHSLMNPTLIISRGLPQMFVVSLLQTHVAVIRIDDL